MNEVTAKAPTGALTPPKQFVGLKSVNDDLMTGVTVSFPILSIANRQWTVRWKGEERVVTLPGHDDIASPYVDVVILNVSKDLSRVYYKNPYGGERNKPDCWATNGIKPDNEVPNPVNPVCGTCPMSAWGSGASPIAPKAQACQQRRRTVVVPYGNDLTNEAEGGPMLLSIPPASLSNQRAYGQELKDLVLPDGSKADVPYYAVITRLSFEKTDIKGQPIKFSKVKFDTRRTQEGYPVFITDAEAEVVLGLRESDGIENILHSKLDPNEAAEGTPTQGQSQVQPPKPAPRPVQHVASAPAPVAPPAPQAQPAPPAPKVGGHPAGITEAVAKPAAPPPTQRTVQPHHMPPAVVDDETMDEPPPEASAADKMTTLFQNLMGGK